MRRLDACHYNLENQEDYGVGRECGVGRGLGVALGVVVGVTLGVGVGVAVGVTVGVGVGVGVTVGVGVGEPPPTAARMLSRPHPYTLFGGPASPH